MLVKKTHLVLYDMEQGRKITPPKFRKVINRFVSKFDSELLNPIQKKLQNSEKFITIESLGNNGRLGNQLFQIASTIGIGIKNNAKPIFSSWYCNYTNKDMSVYFENSLDYRKEIHPESRYIERTFNYHDIEYKNNMIIKGYYQSEKYFSHCQDIIRYYFEPSLRMKKKMGTIYSDMGLENKKTCSIHIRRGDYVDHPIHGVCDIEYYKKGVSTIEKMTNIDYFLIFSDDVEWCKKEFRSDNFLFSEKNNDIEDLFLMSLCDNHIISNSSFSWWGSWLCNNPEKIVITPSLWFKPGSNIDDRDIFPKNSIKI